MMLLNGPRLARGILSESHFNIIFSLGQVEPVQDGRQPGVEVCRLATPGRCIKLRRFETGVRLLNEGGGFSNGGGVGVDHVICGLVTGLKVERLYMKNSRLVSTW